MDLEEFYQRERYADFVREADHDRQVRAAEQALEHKPFYKSLLSVVGGKLIEVGNRLQDNVETVKPAPMFSATKRA